MSEQNNTDMAQHFYRASAADFMKIPGSPVAYWASNAVLKLFERGNLGDFAYTRLGMATADNNRFIRLWHEVSFSRVCLDAETRAEASESKKRWFPYQKGGDYRKWYGNNEYLVNWESDGLEIQNFKDETTGRVRSHNYNLDFIFSRGVTWNALSSGKTAARITENALFDNAGSSLFVKGMVNEETILGLINSKIMLEVFPLVSPTLNYQPGDLSKLPAFFPSTLQQKAQSTITKVIAATRKDWDSYETSWGFRALPIVDYVQSNLPDTYKMLRNSWRDTVKNIKLLEEENNRILLEEYGLIDELSLDVPLKEITVTCNPYYRFDGNLGNEELEERLRCDTLLELLSYSIGCMMGRYSLDKPGLILASQSETIQDYIAQIPSPQFMPDDDAILPLTDEEWFADDVTNRFREFVKVVWGEETLQENLDFVAESLCLHAIKPKKSETAMDTIRRYLSMQFFKDHMKTYKKRPIYWLFSSGKQKAFECLVYLHRYNEGILSRMRTEYVTPLMGKYESQINHIEEQQQSATTAEKNKLAKALKGYQAKLNELREFDNKLKHYADRRIQLDLDDGVKVNYGKFGDLLANVKDITGKKPTD